MAAPVILLVNPWIHDFAAYDLWIRPVGLLSVASILKKSGCDVHVLDCLDSFHPAMRKHAEAAGLKHKATGQGQFFKQHIKKPDCLSGVPRNYSRYGMVPEVFMKELQNIPRPDAVLVGSMMTYWYTGVLECITLIKQVLPDTPVVLGGIYATLCHEHALYHSGADRVINGPFTKENLKTLESVLKRPLMPAAVDAVPCPACEFLYSKKVIPLLTSRGCPLACPYCASKQLWPDFLQRNPHGIAEDIRFWHERHGSTDFAFYDDALLINPQQHIVPVLESVIAQGLQLRFHVPNGLHVKSINDRLADLMMQAGFKTLRLGFETADPELQHRTGDKTSQNDFTKACKALRAAGFTEKEVGVYILAGLPGQTVQSVRASISFVRDHGYRPYLTEYSPIPGTRFWDQAVACSPFPIEREPLFQNNTLLPCRSDAFTIDDLETLKLESRRV